MASFSSSEINDAKRRVQEMRRRAQDFVGDNDNNGNETKSFFEEPADNEKNQSNSKDKPENDVPKNDTDKKGSSFALILALILILSNEDADNMLILALLYILL